MSERLLSEEHGVTPEEYDAWIYDLLRNKPKNVADYVTALSMLQTAFKTLSIYDKQPTLETAMTELEQMIAKLTQEIADELTSEVLKRHGKVTIHVDGVTRTVDGFFAAGDDVLPVVKNRVYQRDQYSPR